MKLDLNAGFDGETGVIGEPEATPDPEPELELEPPAPVAKGPDAPVPVANPVATATPLVLWMRVSQGTIVVNGLGCLTRRLWSLCMNIPCQSMWMWMYIQLGKELSCWSCLMEMLCLMRMPSLKLSWSMLRQSLS